MTDNIAFAVQPDAQRLSDAERGQLLADPGFGKVFTDHMATIRWSGGQGWHSAEVRARAPFTIDPASAVLHYAQEIFEGMKAYRSADGRISLFRPEENARRFRESAARMAMPQIPEHLFLAAVEKLVDIERDWVPDAPGSLYLRPFMFASEAFLGVRPATEYIFCVIASPAGPYFKGGGRPLTLWVSERFTRAAPGGTGAAKCGGNYAGGLAAQAEAILHDCDQVVFLDASGHRGVEELGGMNIFFVLDDRIVTPPLGTILPGITRASIIALARDAGFTVEERPYSFDQWCDDAQSGRLQEAFACGTAAVVAAVGTVRHAKGAFMIGDGGGGPTTALLREQLVGIHTGARADPNGWVRYLT